MHILKSTNQANKKFRLSNGAVIETDCYGNTSVDIETKELLLSDKYKFKGFELIEEDEIKKVEESQPFRKAEEGEPIEPQEEEASLKEVIESIEDFNSLKAIAKDLNFPEEEWEGYKRRDYFKNYLLSKVEELD